tara:strand:+ start:2498 stop:3112 length:615 start_codon:yes stop_codon:yes gene_type:complete
MRTTKFHALFVLIIAAIPQSGLVNAGVIASQTSRTGFKDSWYQAVAFTLGNAYENVVIEAFLGGSGTVYLTTQIGASTTPDHEVARTDYVGDFNGQLQFLFSDLQLDAGSYFLVRGGEFASSWLWNDRTVSATVDKGVTIDGNLTAAPSREYAPALDYDDEFTSNRRYLFTVTGDLVAVSEPGVFAMLIFGLFGNWLYGRRVRQ